MNNIVIAGKVISAPQIRYTPDNQTPIAELTIEVAPLKEGDRPSSIKVVAWGELSKTLDWAKEGVFIIVKGRMQINSIDRPEGFKEKRVELIAREFYPGSEGLHLNVVCVVGRCGASPETKYFESGSVVSKVNIAVDRNRKDASPDWVSIEGWSKSAEVMGNYVKKGSLIGVEGSLKFDYWNDRNSGVERSNPIVKIDNLRLLGSKNDNEGGENQGYTQSYQTGANKGRSNPPKQPANVGASKVEEEVDYDSIPFAYSTEMRSIADDNAIDSSIHQPRVGFEFRKF